MTDREMLLRAVAANPDDDTPRLIYADHLDELGGDANVARARFIRLQIEIDRGPGPGDTGSTFVFDRDCAELEALAKRFRNVWLTEYPQWMAPIGDGGSHAKLFSRGFAERFVVKPALMQDSWTELFAIAPIQSLRVELAPPTRIEELFDCSVLGFLRELDLAACPLTDKELRELARSDKMPELQTLHLGGPGLTEHGVVAVLLWRNFPRLRTLDLRRHCPFDLETIIGIRNRCPGKRILH